MEPKKDTKFFIVTAVPRRGFRRCGYSFNRSPQLISVEDMLERDASLKVGAGTTARRILAESKMLIVKQLDSKPTASESEKITAQLADEASLASKGRTTEKILASKEAQAEREVEAKTPRRRSSRMVEK